MIKKNIIANYLGQGWVTLMGFIFIPVYIKILGIEAFGIIGLSASLITILSLFDLGLSTVINKEFSSLEKINSSYQNIINLLRTIEVLIIINAIVIIIIINLSSNWIATNWIKKEEDLNFEIELIVNIFSFVIGLKLIEGIYRGALIGMQKQVLYNWGAAVIATIRGVGAIVVLVYFSPTIKAFFYWQIIISFVSTLYFGYITYKEKSLQNLKGHFSFEEINKIRKFAIAIIGMNILNLILTQIDKILLSTILNMKEYGYYILAVTLVAILNVLIAPIAQALFPRLCELHNSKNYDEYIRIFHKTAQFATLIVGSVSAILISYPELILKLWINEIDIIVNVSPLIRILALATFINCIMWLPFQVEMSSGSVKIINTINIVSCIIMVPFIIILVPIYGSIGAAALWLLLNIIYFTFGGYVILRKIMKTEIFKWYMYDVLFPFIQIMIGFNVLKLFFNTSELGYISSIFYLIATIIIGLITLILTNKDIRRAIKLNLNIN